MRSAETALSAMLLVAQRGQVTVTELACALGIAPSTAHRALTSCRNLGVVRQDSHGGPYLIGPALHEMTLMGTSASSLRDAVDSVLHDLHVELGETVGVMILEGQNVRLVQSLIAAEGGHASTRVGQVFPAHATAGGKAILSALSYTALAQRYPGGVLAPLADGSTVSWTQFERELGVARRRGWAYARGASDLAVGAIAAPVVIASGEPIAALTVVAPVSRLATRAEAEAMAAPLVSAVSHAQSRLRGGSD